MELKQCMYYMLYGLNTKLNKHIYYKHYLTKKKHPTNLCWQKVTQNIANYVKFHYNCLVFSSFHHQFTNDEAAFYLTELQKELYITRLINVEIFIFFLHTNLSQQEVVMLTQQQIKIRAKKQSIIIGKSVHSTATFSKVNLN